MDLAVGQNRRIVVGIDIDSHTVRVHRSATVAGGRDSAVVKRIRVVQGVHGGPVVRFVESDRNRAFDWEPLVAHKPEQVDNILLQGFVHYDLSPVEFSVERIILNIGNRQTIQYLLRSRRPRQSFGQRDLRIDNDSLCLYCRKNSRHCQTQYDPFFHRVYDSWLYSLLEIKFFGSKKHRKMI